MSRFLNVGISLTEFLLPDRLLLNVDDRSGAIRLTNWPAYECAVRTMLRSRHVEEHLDRVNLPKSEHYLWYSDDVFCKATIALNVSNFERLFNSERMSKTVGEIWRESRNLYEASCELAAE